MFLGFGNFNLNNMFGGFSQFFGGYPPFGCISPATAPAFMPMMPTYYGSYPLNISLFNDGLGGIQNQSYTNPSIFSNTQFTNPFNLSFNNIPNINPFNFSFNYQSQFKPEDKASKVKKGPYSKISLSTIENAGLKFLNPGRDRARWDKMDPEFQVKFLKLIEYAKSKGIKISLQSGLRTESEQQALIAKGRPAAKKGSKHLTGRAADIVVDGNSSKNLAILGQYWKKELGGRWGQDFKSKNFPAEPWHFDVG